MSLALDVPPDATEISRTGPVGRAPVPTERDAALAERQERIAADLAYGELLADRRLGEPEPDRTALLTRCLAFAEIATATGTLDELERNAHDRLEREQQRQRESEAHQRWRRLAYVRALRRGQPRRQRVAPVKVLTSPARQRQRRSTRSPVRAPSGRKKRHRRSSDDADPADLADTSSDIRSLRRHRRGVIGGAS